MAPRKCSVSTCNASSDTHQLYKFPSDDKLRSLWLSFLVPSSPSLLLLNKWQLIQKLVCQRHFDRQQFRYGQRIRYSYPCLLSEKEITHGVPLSLGNEHIPRFLQDHNYYHPPDEKDSLKIPEPNNLPDHSYDISFKNDYDCNTPDENNLFYDQQIKFESNKNASNELDWRVDEELGQATVDKKSEQTNDTTNERGPYTWQQKSSVVPGGEDDDDNHAPVEDMDLTMFDSYEDVKPVVDFVHAGFKCNFCQKDIIGFRYTCVVCADYDLCGACEARREHPHHYVLRIPHHRPYNEIQEVLRTVRRALLFDSIVHVRGTTEGDGSVEIKEEDIPDPIEIEENPHYESEEAFTATLEEQMTMERGHMIIEGDHMGLEGDHMGLEGDHMVVEVDHMVVEGNHMVLDNRYSGYADLTEKQSNEMGLSNFYLEVHKVLEENNMADNGDMHLEGEYLKEDECILLDRQNNIKKQSSKTLRRVPPENVPLKLRKLVENRLERNELEHRASERDERSFEAVERKRKLQNSSHNVPVLDFTKEARVVLRRLSEETLNQHGFTIIAPKLAIHSSDIIQVYPVT